VLRSNELVPENLKRELIGGGSSRGIFLYATTDDGRDLCVVVEPVLISLGLRTIEDVPEERKYWHPQSNNQILDLVHPSLYPLVYNNTKSLETCLPIPIPQVVQTLVEAEEDKWVDLHGENPNIRSTQFQWLPSDFKVSADGKTKIKSYINNPHPIRHRDLCSTIRKIFLASSPPNLVLDDLERKAHKIRRVETDLLQQPEKHRDRYPTSRELVDWDFGWDMGKLAGKMFSPPQFSANTNGKTVKVITKSTNMHLTPRNPEYPRGTWHVEGMNVCSLAASSLTRAYLRFLTNESPERKDSCNRNILLRLRKYHRLSPRFSSTSGIL